MLPVCSATPCSSHSQILLYDGWRYFSRSQRAFDVSVRCLSGETSVSSLSSGISSGACLQKEAAHSLYTEFVGGHRPLLSNEWQYNTGNLRGSYFMGGEHLKYVEDTTAAILQQEAPGNTLVDSNDILLEPNSSEPTSILDRVADSTTIVPDASSTTSVPDAFSITSVPDASSIIEVPDASSITSVPDASSTINVPDTSSMNTESFSTSSNSFEDLISQTNKSVGASASKGEGALSSSVDKVTSAITDIIKDSNEAIENLTNKVFSSVDQSGELTRNKLSSLPGELKEASNKAGGVVLELLRKSIVVAEESIVKGSKFAYYSYETSKEFLPPDIQNALNSIEEKTSEVSRPVGMVFLQVYSAIEGLERSLGLDPLDPIVPFVFFLGTASTLWAVYWVAIHSGYAGNLSPKSAFELLKGKNSAVLIDVRPEDLKQRDGIPDLRRAARFRYADVSLPKVDGSMRKLMKSSRDLDDTLIATVIRNLKNVQDRSKIIVMDADGTHVKGIARSLRKLGIKQPYVLQGGFQSWIKQGLRVKELKPETAITILNEEAEAILEELSPSPLQLVAFGVGSVAGFYALLEWEKSLQLIGVIGLAQTIYRRLASYEDSEDFRKDVRLLLFPVTLGAEALTWATGKVETNGNGLPVSPSSSDVQSRVLQAAAKHESQPFDAEGSQDSVLDSTTVNENADPSEA